MDLTAIEALVRGGLKGYNLGQQNQIDPYKEAQLDIASRQWQEGAPKRQADLEYMQNAAETQRMQLDEKKRQLATEQFYRFDQLQTEAGGVLPALKTEPGRRMFLDAYNNNPVRERMGLQQVDDLDYVDESNFAEFGMDEPTFRQLQQEHGSTGMLIPLARDADGNLTPLPDADGDGVEVYGAEWARDNLRTLFDSSGSLATQFQNLQGPTPGMGASTTVTRNGGGNPLAVPPQAGRQPQGQLQGQPSIGRLGIPAEPEAPAKPVPPIWERWGSDESEEESTGGFRRNGLDIEYTGDDNVIQNAYNAVTDTVGKARDKLASFAEKGVEQIVGTENLNAGNERLANLGAEIDRTWNRMIGAESNGEQFDSQGKPLRSPKGATGIAQVMPATAKEVAEKNGIPWDRERYENDADYNMRLGRAYYDEQVETYGDPIMAAAAYNAGPGMVNDWVNGTNHTGRNSSKLKLGDPRSADVDVTEWINKIPYKETRNYVAKTTEAGLRATAKGDPIARRVVDGKGIGPGQAKRVISRTATMDALADSSSDQEMTAAMSGMVNSLTPNGASATYSVNSGTGRPTHAQIAQAVRLRAAGWLDDAQFKRYVDTGVVSADAVQLIGAAMQQSTALASNDIAQQQQTARTLITEQGKTLREGIKAKGDARDDFQNVADTIDTITNTATDRYQAMGLDEETLERVLPRMRTDIRDAYDLFPSGLQGTDWNNQAVANGYVRLQQLSQQLQTNNDWIPDSLERVFKDNKHLEKDPAALFLAAQNPEIFKTVEGAAQYADARERYKQAMNGQNLYQFADDPKARTEVLLQVDKRLRAEGTNFSDEVRRDQILGQEIGELKAALGQGSAGR
ncbi:transglycosylase SLT domain-containing protein [Gallaecimonas pentaromativorans]|uniref:transglycosylase SLT domain-containing protein n=1 Tax=Gallaecimonas pentaromativorans TaxID=584787 RepID=UPI003A8FFB8C